MVAGIVLLALGLKKVLEYVGDTEHHHLDDPLKGIGLYALFFGVVLYLLGHVGFKWRTTHRVGISRLITAALCILALPLLAKVPALGQLAVLAALLIRPGRLRDRPLRPGTRRHPARRTRLKEKDPADRKGLRGPAVR